MIPDEKNKILNYENKPIEPIKHLTKCNDLIFTLFNSLCNEANGKIFNFNIA